MKKVYLVHCWEGRPQDGWYPWLKTELQDRGFEVNILKMPNTDEPVFSEWLSHLRSTTP
ncbi:alpha/beta hydrolase [Patescibacteria group bacterium]|nr:alpha/beta hydrolase [Patescibacteria group bacterium]MBU1921604.1 alpha/beta hydrolase [Patescibacteria group bacterium]